MNAAEKQLEELGSDEVRNRIARGDYVHPTELRAATNWLKAKDKDSDFLAECQRASISAALDATRLARRANYIAITAVMVAAMGAHEKIRALFGILIG